MCLLIEVKMKKEGIHDLKIKNELMQ